jgi:hypothetical protein
LSQILRIKLGFGSGSLNFVSLYGVVIFLSLLEETQYQTRFLQ